MDIKSQSTEKLEHCLKLSPHKTVAIAIRAEIDERASKKPVKTTGKKKDISTDGHE